MTERLSGLLLAALLCVATAFTAAAQEDPDRIPRFAADIVVEADGSLLVTEAIDFLVTPESWKHGIFRDFPTRYRDLWGFTRRVGFEVLDVTRDGVAEPYVLEPGPYGMRVRIGAAEVWLDKGIHHYRIVYRTTRQLLFHAGADELYWNVTGNDWVHPIDRAEATVHLPAGAESLSWAVYTGYDGEVGGDYRRTANPDGSVTFAATRTLAPGEGLTVAISFPKDFVAEPDGQQRLANAVADNLGTLVALLGLIVTAAFFLIQWYRVGRDPEAGIIIPLFEMPDDLSPAATGYVWAQARGEGLGGAKSFAVALTSLAIKGLLTIEKNKSRYTLTKQSEKRQALKLPPGEAAVMKSLFPGDRSSTVIKPKYTPEIRAAVDEINNVLAREYADTYFRHNTAFWLLGALLAVATVIAGLLIQAGTLEPLPFIALGGFFGLLFTIPVVMVGRQLVAAYRKILRGDAKLSPGYVIMTLFILPFMTPGLAALVFTYYLFGLPLAIATVAQLINLVLFWTLLKAPTRMGRDMLDRIEGYRLYLSVAEADRLNMLTGEPEMTVELFEYHLPYAMALDVEEAWTARFTASADAATRQAAETRSRSWYTSNTSRSGVTAMTKGLTSGLSSTLSSAATKPSRSGGSSGGGSSGGGGGGGGGGSW